MAYYVPPVFLPTRYRALPGKKDSGDHWQGGAPIHEEAVCPSCVQPYLMLWDINCFDKRWNKVTFGPWERLPLYFCWHCVNDVAYHLEGDGTFHLLNKPTGSEVSNFYEPYPISFKRVPLAFDGGWSKSIERIVDKLFDDTKQLNDDTLTKQEQTMLNEYCGHDVPMPLFFYFHQFGGIPLHRSWSEEPIECPNPNCRLHPLSKLLFGRKKRKMSFLAGILNDPWRELPMVEQKTPETKKHFNHFEVTVQFHICPGCFTVHACNRCT